ncbi:hypothetical protein [Shewanella waksmanii]|uniref:hypothetical protein n=1 Tax=Shewanella waksmanii TaxID=213783 RepID=UPI00048B3E93|nr:hypothetical protein [Shewanella waksmanii]
MKELLNKKNLLIVVAVLVVIKFGLTPVWEWQDTKVNQIKQLKSRLDRAEALSEQGSEFESVLEQAKSINKSRLDAIHVSQDISALKLAKMEELDRLLASFDVRITSSSWLADSGSDLTVLNLKLSVRGSTKNLFKSVLSIRQMPQATVINDLSFRVVRMQGDTLGDAGGSMVVSFYVLGPELAAKYGVEVANADE